ncbi:hypothetical protein AYK25_04685 [Thermoplasmatales archaeon SM1-50]|nr:MAG: hypothetical protein AYK25_04685 [Thermoplasmatales archaeon SM1-50]
MRNSVWMKGFVIGIIVLFVGASIPNITGETQQLNVKSNMQNTEITSQIQTSLIAPPDEEWSKTFGGTDEDIGYSVQQTTDGGYIITGETSSYGAGNADVWLIKTDKNGNKLWSRTFGGTSDDDGRSVQQTTDGGYIIAGTTGSYGPIACAAWLIKTNANGIEEWNSTFGESNPNQGSFGYSAQQTTDGGYIMTGGYRLSGMGTGTIWLIKTDANGNELWNKTYVGTIGESVQQTTDGGYIITAIHYYSMDPTDIILIKTDTNGNAQWIKTLLPLHGYCGSGQQTTDGGYIIVGTQRYPIFDMWLMKTDANGDEQWNKTFGGFYNEFGNSIQQTADECFIITGDTYSYGAGGFDVWLLKTDVNGNELWNKTFGGIESDSGLSVQQTTDGGYIITGSTLSYGSGGSDVYLIKVETENSPPNKPNKPSGETSGKLNTPYIYSTNTTDPNGDQVWYQWDWGDSSTSSWLGPYNSGVIISTTHTWTVKSSSVKVKAKDIYGAESPFSDPLPITMPYSYNIPLQWFWERLFQRFPTAFPLLRHLMGY